MKSNHYGHEPGEFPGTECTLLVYTALPELQRAEGGWQSCVIEVDRGALGGRPSRAPARHGRNTGRVDSGEEDSLLHIHDGWPH